MPLLTTVLGSFPKPDYLPLPDWFRSEKSCTYTIKSFNDVLHNGKNLDELTIKALKDVIQEQTDIGINVITDGEQARETYFLHFCRHIDGFDFDNTVRKSIRNGADTIDTPVLITKILSKAEPFACKEWKTAQDATSLPVKYTLPGPMTILNSTTDDFYNDMEKASADLVKVLNREILELVNAGCRHIQLDEPVLVRDLETALRYGLEHAEKCFDGVPDHVIKSIHICCGYPQFLDQEGYAKADPSAYFTLAPLLDKSRFDWISIEDAQCYNDLSLFSLFKNKTVVLGVVQIARSRVEPVDEIKKRVEDVLNVLPKERLVLAPDCGLAFLVDQKTRLAKLKNMVTAANAF